MTTTHTPGPWIASNVPTIEDGLTSWHVFTPNGKGYVIARTGLSNIGETLAAAQANARLIAAAPDLLDALHDCALVLDSANRHVKGTCNAFIQVLEKARTALAKATA
jgi:hypothetical protein